MNKYLIATHFQMASGVKSSVKALVGDIADITVIDAYSENVNLNEEANKFLNSLASKDVAIIFTDIKFGSVNQYFMKRTSGLKNVYLISGINLPVVLELVLYTDEINKDKLISVIKEAQKELCLVSVNSDQELSEDELFN